MSLDRPQTTQSDHIEDSKRDSLPKLSRPESSTPEVIIIMPISPFVLPLPKKLKSSTLTAFQETRAQNTPSFNIRSKIAEPVVAAFIAGGVAGAVSRTIVSPLERLKILLQVQSAGREEYRLSIWKALVKMWREEGWKGFMRGNGTNCIRIVPYSAVQFGSYNFYKKVSCKAKAIYSRETRTPFDSINPPTPFQKNHYYIYHTKLNCHSQFAETSPGADLSPINRLVCGGAAGITSVTITYPLDIVRTRLSIQSASFSVLEKRGVGERLPGMFRTMTLMYRNEGGIIALYRGIIPTVTGVAPYVSLTTCSSIFRVSTNEFKGRAEFYDI